MVEKYGEGIYGIRRMVSRTPEGEDMSDLDDAIRNHEQYMASCCGRPSNAAAELTRLRADLDEARKHIEILVEQRATRPAYMVRVRNADLIAADAWLDAHSEVTR